MLLLGHGGNMQYVFLVNVFSLGNEISEIVGRIEIVARTLKLDYKIEFNSSSVTTEDILDRYKNSQNIIISLGGDGTINRTLNGIVGTKNALGFIPYGTGNDFYRSARELLDEGINKVDLVRINDRYFINVCCFGIDADIANTDVLIHSKLIPKSQRYNISIINHFLKYKARRMRVIVDGNVYDQEFTTVAVCNARYYGGGYKVGTNALMNDGLVDVYMADKMSKLGMADLILGMKQGKHETSPSVRVLKTSKLRIETEEEVICNIDGDKLSGTTFDIEVIPQGIDVFYNQHMISEVADSKILKL